MTESNHSQLRFDILETVRLHPHQEGIGNLLSLDLYPDVEIEDQGTHLKIHGYLRLNGEYVGSQEEEPSPGGEEEDNEAAFKQQRRQSKVEEIAYVIPVEITLPADRVDADRISSEIDSFDYQVLSPFELQIEAVLTIDGLREEEQKKEESEYEVVDRMATFSVPESGRMEIGDSEGSEESEETVDDEEEIITTVEDLKPPQEEYQFVHVARNDPLGEVKAVSSDEEEEPKEETEEESGPNTAAGDEADKEKWAFEEVDAADDGDSQEASGEPQATEKELSEEEEPSVDKDATEAPEEQEKTIVFKPAPPIRDREDHQLTDQFLRSPHDGEFDFQDLNGEEKRFGAEDRVESAPEETEGIPEEDATAVEEQEEKTTEAGLDWIKWMLREEEESFTKLKMVIVHEEDSIDSLAERYEVPATKIITMNQLESHVLEEGQIVYIPTENK
ncbi:MAG: LysM peptidoglycan-binding domain-containing protein [Firmicutes bacterium]|uniref:LysM peptidoglycan-binding domain-containing protein n=1 Tax=Melghirimyces thermohalophilus TaxID=1236220 RepID=UPI00115FD643|nr:LysM peptidoglycan-binding domain-containing protein [Melghirimyces thermohalophilus]MDA8353957.1 LysM peptidoglycan-binding domain-containing protein [Bacillota bacterium]